MGAEPQRVRIICTDPNGAVLLLKWRDPIDRTTFWEPPGGGIEAGETVRQAAQRELYEETGLTPAVSEYFALVERDYHWLGKHYVHLEAFFLATSSSTDVRLALPTEEEVATFLEARFVPLEDLAYLSEPIEPADLRSIVNHLTDCPTS